VDLELDDEQLALAATVRRCFAERAPINPYVREHVGGRPWASDDAWTALVDVGATGVVAPARCGGLDLGLVEAALVAEEAGRALYPGPWACSAVGAVRLLLATPENADAAAIVETLVAGSTIAAGVLPAPIDHRGPAVTLTGGQLSGRVEGVLGATVAGTLVVVAREGDELCVVVTDASDNGVTVTRDASVDGTREIGTVTFDGATGTRLGAISAGDVHAVADALLVVLGADAVGAATAVFELAVAYAKERHQFGQPIGAFQAVQHLCVDMLETVELARGGVLHAAWALDAGDPGAHRAALRLKGFADRLATVADTAIQVFGGIGYTWEHDSHLFLKRLLTWSAYQGPPGHYRRELGRALALARD